MSRNHSLPRLIIAWALLSIGAVVCVTGMPLAPVTLVPPEGSRPAAARAR